MTDRPDVLDDRVFDSVISCAAYSAMSEVDRQKYDEAIMTELDYQGALDYAAKHNREEGLKEGLKEGREEGREEGSFRQQLFSVKSMMSHNVSDSDIMTFLGISLDRLKELKSHLNDDL